MLTGLSTINIELTSRCNKSCSMCGRRKRERDCPEIKDTYGDMEFDLIEKIAAELPPGIVVQLHNNGEPTLYPLLGEAIGLFDNQLTSFNTNGILLVEKADEIIGKLDTIVISVIQDDPMADDQYETLKEFIHMKGDRQPLIVLRFLGEIDRKRYEWIPGVKVSRTLHDPMGSFKYKKTPTIPEVGVCLDLLHHLAIDRFGVVSPCVRFDPERLHVIGDLANASLDEIWNGEARMDIVGDHLRGNRSSTPICAKCSFWGVPTGD